MLFEDITFKKLAIFIAFMSELNISRTAEKLNMSTVSVHRALHSLEEQVEFPLFKRKGRKLVPLESASELLIHARQVIGQFRSGLEAAKEKTGFSSNILRLGILSSLLEEVLPNLLGGMKQRKPELKIEVMTGSNSALMDMMNTGTLDAILLGSPYPGLGTEQAITVFSEDMFFACLNSSKFAHKKQIDLASLVDEPFISLSKGFSVFLHSEESYRRAGLTPKFVATVHDIFSMVFLVSKGIGYALMPGRMRKMCDQHSIVLIPLKPEQRCSQDIMLVFKKNNEMNPNILSLSAECRTYRKKFLSGK